MTALAGLLSEKMLAQQDVARLLAIDILGPATRGRDDRNAFVQGPCAIAAHTHRTIDLTPDGAQPFTTAPFTVALDGYVANALVLRREMEDTGNATFRGHGDAEIIAHGAKLWGLNRLLQKLEGAFTFALWDAENAALHLVRDRMGARPLYVTAFDGMTVFASDLQGFRRLPGFSPMIDTEGAAAYLAFGHVASPRTLWKDVISVPPGHRMMIKTAENTLPKTEMYWSPATTVEESALRGGGDSTRLERLIAALSGEATRLDVPFSVIDDFTPSTFQLRSNLDRASDKPYKGIPLTLPDGAALQIAYESLSSLPEPVSDPMAASWYLACKNAANDTGVLLAANGVEMPTAEDSRARRLRKTLDLVPDLLKPLLPARFAGISGNAEARYLARTRLWPLPAPDPEVIEPRIDATLAQRVAFYECADRLRNAVLPGLDRIAFAAGIELRLPMADARVLDIGLPAASAAGNPDIATWLRGPLRPRVAAQMTKHAFDRLGIEQSAPFTDAWKDFLAGDNTRTRSIWALSTLLAWSGRQ